MIESQITHNDDAAYTPLVCVHGTGGTGPGLQAELESVIRSALTFNSLLLFPSYETPYQFLIPNLGEHLIAHIDQLRTRRNLTAQIILFGFSGGAQFCQRFALQFPQHVRACVALAAGCWTDADGNAFGMMVDEEWFSRPPWDDERIQRAKHIPAAPGYAKIKWVVGCGSQDNPSRVASAQRFEAHLAQQGAEVVNFPSEAAHTFPDPAKLATVFEQLDQWADHPSLPAND